jgi:hypothetical protein
MNDQTAIDYAEVQKHCLPGIYKFVVAIAHENENGNECMGSGVQVNVQGRHFIATAKHVIERKPRIIHSDFYLVNGRIGTDRPVNILKAGRHPTLDVGFLEIALPLSSELNQNQLCFNKPISGSVFVVGHPVSTAQLINDEYIINRCSFGTVISEATEEYWKLEYPREGVRPENGAWVKGSPMLDVPGFSGGGCFGITQTHSNFDVIDFKLLGIQSSWHKGERWVKVVPIKHWLGGVQQAIREAAKL